MTTRRKKTKTPGKPQSRLKKSKLENLYVHQNGTYYLRVQVNGKPKELSLRTKDYTAAAQKLPLRLAEFRGASEAHLGKGLAEAIHREAHRPDADLKQTTRHYYEQVAKSIIKSLPDHLASKRLDKVSVGDLREWRDDYWPTVSATRHNGALALLRRVWLRAIERKEVATNPIDSLKRIKPKDRKWTPPTKGGVAAIVESIAQQGKTHSKATAAAVEFLAYTGFRISEAQEARWSDINGGLLMRRVAKNDEVRSVPLIPAAVGLLERLKADGVPHGADDPIMLIKSPRIALGGACKRLKVGHLRVHDLRHIFATRCLEAGVDFPTLAGWLGHQDGGILAAKTYGHLVPDHSVAQAGKVDA
jgi:integrase